MSNMLRNNFSSNYIFDQYFKQNIFETEKLSQLHTKTENRAEHNDVIIKINKFYK
jgi:hypothetical protein